MRVIARFDKVGRYVWHCHILSHEDHEMMRPFYVGNIPDYFVQNSDGAADAMQDKILWPNDDEGPVILTKNNPNPFSNMATIEFKLSGFDSDVAIDVFSLTGSKVATLYNGVAEADHTYKVEFDGSSLPPGIYIYHINTGDKVYTDKLILIR